MRLRYIAYGGNGDEDGGADEDLWSGNGCEWAGDFSDFVASEDDGESGGDGGL